MRRARKIELTKKWSDYINLHENTTFIVCGCGPSIELIKEIDTSHVILIGVNDIERHLSPKYIVSVDSMGQFSRGGRIEYIVNNNCDTFFTQNDQYGKVDGRFDNTKVCKIDMVNINNAVRSDNGRFDKIFFSNNSTFVASHIAHKMGASKIGLIGVDFTNHNHLSTKSNLKRINNDYSRLNKEIGEKMYNLSPTSELTSIPYKNIKDFIKNTK